MNIIILFFSLVASHLLKYKFTKIGNDVYSGCDERHPIRENNITTLSDEDRILTEKIANFFLYKDMLQTLENEKVSIQDKLRIIEDNNIMHLRDSSKYTTNMLAGGLIDDFNFEI